MFEESEVKIYKTTDYGMFKHMLGNRDTKSESKIVQSIKQVGYILNPIIVNEKYEIIDGQNRLEALKSMELPVYFTISEGLDIKACRSLNIGQTNWTTEDYICSYADGGDQSYRRLASLVTEFGKAHGLQGIVAMAKPLTLNESGGLANSRLRDGDFKMSQEEYETAVTRLNSTRNLGYVAFCKRKKLSARTYWACVSYIYQHQGVNAKDVIEALLQYETIIPSCTRVSEQLQFFDDAINRNKRRPTDKVFLSTDFQKRKYIER